MPKKSVFFLLVRLRLGLFLPHGVKRRAVGRVAKIFRRVLRRRSSRSRRPTDKLIPSAHGRGNGVYRFAVNKPIIFHRAFFNGLHERLV